MAAIPFSLLLGSWLQKKIWMISWPKPTFRSLVLINAGATLLGFALNLLITFVPGSPSDSLLAKAVIAIFYGVINAVLHQMFLEGPDRTRIPMKFAFILVGVSWLSQVSAVLIYFGALALLSVALFIAQLMAASM